MSDSKSSGKFAPDTPKSATGASVPEEWPATRA